MSTADHGRWVAWTACDEPPEEEDDDSEWEFTHCTLCGSDEPIALVDVRWERGDAFALPGRTALCATCSDLYTGRRVDLLAVRLQDQLDEVGREAVVGHLVDRGSRHRPLPPT